MRDQAFAQLVETHGDSLLRMCCLYLNDGHLAEDAVQDTFVKAYRSLARFRGDCSEKTWLMRIAINTCKNYRRSPWHRWVDRRVPLDMLPECVSSDSHDDGALLAEIMRLNNSHKEVILLYYYQELTAAEIAAVLGIHEKAVFARMARARRQLKSRLEGWFFDE